MSQVSVILALLCMAVEASAFTPPPPPPRFVYDGAGVLDAGSQARLESRLMDLNAQHAFQIGVALFKSLEGESLEDVTMRLAEAWKPGQKGQDNGIVLAAFMEDRKVRIEVGYGLEDKIPDALASRIIRTDIAPAFREGKVGEGLMQAVDDLASAALGNAAATTSRGAEGFRGGQRSFGGGFLCVFLSMWLVVALLSRTARRSHGFGYRGRSGGLPWWAWMLMGSQLGGRNTHRRGGGGFGGFGGGGGGGSFGGGSFGGGGSSGSW